MKVSIIESFNVRLESLFAVLTDIQNHTVWAEGSIELVSLTDNAVKLGTRWELMCELLGRRLVTANACNVYEPDHKFGWVTENPITSQTYNSPATRDRLNHSHLERGVRSHRHRPTRRTASSQGSER